MRKYYVVWFDPLLSVISFEFHFNIFWLGNSLVVWWLRLHTPNAGALGSILGQGTRPHMLQLGAHLL